MKQIGITLPAKASQAPTLQRGLPKISTRQHELNHEALSSPPTTAGHNFVSWSSRSQESG